MESPIFSHFLYLFIITYREEGEGVGGGGSDSQRIPRLSLVSCVCVKASVYGRRATRQREQITK